MISPRALEPNDERWLVVLVKLRVNIVRQCRGVEFSHEIIEGIVVTREPVQVVDNIVIQRKKGTFSGNEISVRQQGLFVTCPQVLARCDLGCSA